MKPSAQLGVAQDDVAARRGNQPGNRSQQGGLAAPARAEQRDELAAPHDEAEAVDRGDIAEADLQLLDRDQGIGLEQRYRLRRITGVTAFI
jgi:hypothetical protein